MAPTPEQNGLLQHEAEKEKFLSVNHNDVQDMHHSTRSVNFDESVLDNKKPSKTIHPRDETAEFTPPDGGWGWVVCLASFWTNGSVFGVLNTFGILYVKLLKEFDDGTNSSDIAFKTCKYEQC